MGSAVVDEGVEDINVGTKVVVGRLVYKEYSQKFLLTLGLS